MGQEYLSALKRHMEQAVEEDMDLEDAIRSFDQSAWQGLANFDALAGRNAHQAYLQDRGGSLRVIRCRRWREGTTRSLAPALPVARAKGVEALAERASVSRFG